MNPNFSEGLLPAVVQDYRTGKVLMVGYMNEEAYKITKKECEVTFWSRSKNRLWKKGETSGNFLKVKDLSIDCDEDTILILADPIGPTCHKGTNSCFKEAMETDFQFLSTLEARITDRETHSTPESSYTAKLLNEGIARVAQKIGEESTELVIEAIKGDLKGICNEGADLLFHFLVLLRANKLTLNDVIAVLKERFK